MVKNFLQRWRTKPITLKEIGLYVGIAVVVFGGYQWFEKEDNATNFRPPEKVYQTTNPHLSEAFSVHKFLGRVHSNTFAMIHPRREGILKDILVDVGDEIKEGQVLAYFFPPGVEGQSASQISKAKAELLKAQEELRNTQTVAQESIGVAEKNLEQAEVNLQTLQQTGQEGKRSTIEQEYDNAETVITQSLNTLRRIFFGSEQSISSVNTIKGTFNNRRQETKVYTLFTGAERDQKGFLELPKNKKRASLYEALISLESLLDESETLYKNAKADTIYSESDIQQNLSTIQRLQKEILAAKEKLDNTLLSTEKTEASVKTAEKNLTLTQSQAEKDITNAQKRVEVAQAAYQAELVKSGHEKIIAPFSGKIAGRFADVGHMLKSSSALFEVIGVNTTLGSQAPLEVRFGLPEDAFELVGIGDKIELSLPDFPATHYRAEVIRQSPQIGGNSHTILVQAVPEEAFLFPHNTNVFVHIADQKNPAFAIPSQAIKKRGSDYFIWTMEEETPQKKQVTVLAEDGEFSDVRGDLTLEDALIINPSVSLFRLDQ